MSQAATLPKRSRSHDGQLSLPFRIPPQEWFTLKQAGAVVGLSESTVEKLYDSGQLTGHSHNAGAGLRDHKRVLRIALVAYAIRTADYDDESLGESLISCLGHLPPATLLRLAEKARHLAHAAR